MAYFGTKDYLIEVAKGNVQGASIINKFGANISLASTYEVISIGGLYMTPQVASVATLRVKAGNALDTAAGVGAREITIEGLDASGALQTASIATAGAVASANFTGTWLRVFRAYVSASGTYANVTSGSHAANIVIETSGGVTWLTIDSTAIPKSQSQIGAYTVPLGYTAYLIDYVITMDTGKTVDFTFFKRENILETVAPYSAMRLIFEEKGMANPFKRDFPDPIKFNALTDIVVLAKGATSPDVTVDFNILLIED